MKKRVWSIAILFCLLLGCCVTAKAIGWNSTFPPKTGIPADAPGERLSGIYNCGQSTVALREDGTFSFTFSYISSYMGFGHYQFQDGELTLSTDDGKFHYVFHKDEENIIFDAEKSSETVWFSELKDGNVFKRVPSVAD